MGKLKLKDLYFGCKNFDFNTGKLETRNLFGSTRVLESIAIFKTNKPTFVEMDDFTFCFGDLRRRVEYEFIVADMFKNNTEQKVDLFTMYAEPNKDYLMELVARVDEKDCERFLKACQLFRAETVRKLEKMLTDEGDGA